MKKVFPILVVALMLGGFVGGCSAQRTINKLAEQAREGSAEAHFQLGKRYWGGRGLEQNRAEAVRRWHAAAEKGHAKAQYYLGSAYWYGNGIARSETEAVRWWRRAAVNGNKDAIKRLRILRGN